MLANIFYWLLSMSINGAVIGLLVLLLCRVKALPRRLALALWLVPLLRLWIPFGLSGRYSVLALLPKGLVRTVPVSSRFPGLTFSNNLQAAKEYFPLAFRSYRLETLFETGALVWLIGMTALLIVLVVLYQSTKRELSDAIHLRGRIWLSSKITGPAVYGLFRQRILLPDGWHRRDQKDLDLILAHEESHIRCRDNLWRLLAFVTASVHWFNPLAWLLLREFLAQLELACDERVLAKYDTDVRKDYARLLVHCAEEKTLFASPFLGSGPKLRTRISHILSFRRMTAISTLFSCLFFAAAGCILLANAPQ